MSKKLHFIYIVICLLLMPSPGRAQGDIATLQAFLDDHRKIGSRLMTRAAVEHINEILHKDSKATCVSYDSLNVQLDKYVHAFDMIDLIVNGGVTVLNTVNTSKRVSKRLIEMKNEIQSFLEELTFRGNIMSSDSIILNRCLSCAENIRESADELMTSLYSLSQYAVPQTGRHMKTTELMAALDAINKCLDEIRINVDNTYTEIMRYIIIRRHYYKKSIYQAKSLPEMTDDAFRQWMHNIYNAHQKR